MSTPRTTAKCVIHTSKGDLEVELWANECPRTSRFFIKCCLNNEFDGNTLNYFIKDRYIKLIRQENDRVHELTLTEPNSRLKVSQDGILCWDIKSDTWLISTQAWDNYFDNNITVFGKIVGDSIYKFRELTRNELDPSSSNTRFLYPAVISNIEITIPYFSDLVTKRSGDSNNESKQLKKQKFMPKVKLNFNDESDESSEDELTSSKIQTKFKMKASPLLNIPEKKVERKVEADTIQLRENHDKTHHSKPLMETTVSDDNKKSNDPTLTEREKQTMKMFEEFRNKTKNKNILSKFSD